MRWFFYNILFAIAYCAMMPKFFLRMKKRGGYRAHFEERFGRYDAETAKKLSEKPRLWIHAVSVGEANLAGQVIRELRRRNPAFSCILSTTSSTGRAVCEKLVSGDDVLIYLPLDFPPCVRRALRVINCTGLVLTEGEFWPNLIRSLHRRKCPLLLLNGRVSDRSAPGYRKLRFFFGPVLRCFDSLLAQSPLDAERLQAAGALPEQITVTGSVKFDITPPAEEKVARAVETLSMAGIVPGVHTVLLGGSTWPGEELALSGAWKKALAYDARLRLVLVPRHFERAPEVTQALEEAGYPVLRRSQCPEARAPEAEFDGKTLPPVLVVDTTGELFALYSQADLVFVGKTLPPNVGGQNMIEPASFGKAVLCGTHTENFVPVMEAFRKAGAIREVASEAALAEAVCALVKEPGTRRALGKTAGETVQASRGALTRSADAIEALFSGTCGKQ